MKNSKIFYDAGQFYWGNFKSWGNKLKITGYNSGVITLNYKKFIDVNYYSDWKKLEKAYCRKKDV